MKDPLSSLINALADRYRVERELGAGGMATVYLAHDLKHDRDVAIKLLHPDLGAALGGERFLSEIRTTARLQHPHILPLLDSGEADGLLYYVMPLVTGETLRARLERERQLPINDAVRIAREVASALDYAHRQNVIHRDIKPENILLHDGSALVADFGIALAVQTAGGQRMTQTGLSLGTPSYMSPEQAMGERTIDARSDIYALGAVTYEMLVGDPPFTGPTVQAIVAKVLTERPASPSAVRDTIPRHIEATVLHALAKLPADRFGSAAEFAHALQHAEDTASLTAAHPSAARDTASARASRAIPWGVAALAVGAATWLWLSRPALTDTVEPPLLAEARGVTFATSASLAGSRMFALSRDGSTMVWRGADEKNVTQLFVSTLGGGEARAIPGTEGVFTFFLSPDAKSVVFLGGGSYQITSVSGGRSRHLMDQFTGLTGMTWTADGWIVITRAGAVSRVRASGGEPEVLRASVDSLARYTNPVEIDASGTLLVGRTRNDSTELVAMSGDDGTIAPLGIAAARGAYARGVLVYVGPDGILQGIPFDPKALRTTGEAMPVGETPIGSTDARYSLSATGLLAFSTEAAVLGDLVLLDRTGRGRVLGERRAYLFPRFAPTGSRIVVGQLSSAENSREGDLWSIDRATGVALRVTTDGMSTRPAWTPDGRSLVFSQRNDKGLQVAARVAADGSTPPARLFERAGGVYELGLTADGRTLVWRQDTPGTGTGRDIFAAPVDTPSAARPVLATRFNERGISVGPVGDWLSYVSNESGRSEVYIRRLAPDSPRWPVSRTGGVEPRWTRSGEVFFRNGDSVFVSRVTLGATPAEAPRIGEPVLLFVGEYQGLGHESTWDASPDGRSFLMVRPVAGSQPTLMLYSNWIERWKRDAAARAK
ncbi:MAG: protein kinase domain-containing protein [Gemmatimonadaceae bacterium]